MFELPTKKMYMADFAAYRLNDSGLWVKIAHRQNVLNGGVSHRVDMVTEYKLTNIGQ